MVDKNTRYLVGWKIWYRDGTVLSSKNNIWKRCKQIEIEVVKMFYKDSKGEREINVHHGQEYYTLDDLEWENIPREIKIGKAMDGEKFWEMFDKARNEKDFVEEMKI